MLPRGLPRGSKIATILQHAALYVLQRPHNTVPRYLPSMVRDIMVPGHGGAVGLWDCSQYLYLT